MTERTGPLTFIQDLLVHGIGPTRGLEMYRQAGGAIGTQRWFRHYREIKDEFEADSTRADEPPRTRPSPGSSSLTTPPALRDSVAPYRQPSLKEQVTVRSGRALGNVAAWLELAPAAVRRRSMRLVTSARQSAPSVTRRLVRPGLAVLLICLAAVALLLSREHTTSFLYLLYVGFSLVLAGVCWTGLVWMLDAWRSPDSFTETHEGAEDLEPRHSFSLIVPVRHEEMVLEATLSRLVATDHPAFEVLVVVGADDPDTREVAERVSAAHPEHVKIVTDHSWPKNKPKALNAALPYCRGDITGVFDAEDDVHPALIQRVDQTFQKTGADVVQAGVQLMNFRSSWFAVRNVLEYYFWFRSRLHFHARHGFIPLGGNTVFVRTHVLRKVEGWDADCLAEDCELGVRLSSLGAQTAVFYEPELATREETPPTLGAFARQRTRWNQGYLQTLSKGYWRRLSLAQQALGVYTLAMPYLMALAWLMIPVAIGTAIALNAPVLITLISFLPLLPMLSVLAVEAAGLADFSHVYGERASARDYARLVLGLPLYQAVLAFAAARAVAREALGVRGWEKTAHFGLHLPHRADGAGDPTTPRLPIPLRPAIASEALAGTPDEPVSRAVAIAETPAGSSLLDGVWVEAPGSGHIVGGAENGSAGTHVEELPMGRPSWAGNGGRPAPPRALRDAVPRMGREPLWVRLSADAPSASAVLSPPSPLATDWPAGLRALRLRDVGGFLVRMLRSHADLAVQLPLLGAVGLVMATNMSHWPDVQFDEGTYVANAWAVQNRGSLAFYTYTYGHPPLAWLAVSLWTWASGIFGHTAYSIDEARELMFVVSIVSCSLLYTLARRIGIGRAFAAAAVILFALSPVGLFFHRAVFLDNPATALALAAFVLALTPRRRAWAFAGSGACFATSVLSKETTLVLLPALLLAAAQNADPRTRRYCLTLLLSFLSLIGLAYPLYATLKGELLPGQGHVSLIGTAIDMLFLRRQSGSIFDPGSAAHATMEAWLHLDPWLLGAALLLAPIALARRNMRAVALAFLIQLAMVLRPGYLPGMFVIAFLPFAALIVAGSAEVVIRFLIDQVRGGPRAGRGSRHIVVSTAHLSLAPVAAVTSALLLGGAALVGVHVALAWWHADRPTLATRLDGPTREAERWLVRNVGRQERLIVTDDVWVYLIEHGFDSRPVEGGFNSRTVVSYWPLDYDPAVKRYFPHAWRDFDYIVSTSAMRGTLTDTPTSAQALEHSRVAARFGRGLQLIEIRAITGDPSPPRQVTATGWNASAVVRWRPPSTRDGGSPIVKYRVVSRPGRIATVVSADRTWGVVRGLENGVRYTFGVTAVNGRHRRSHPSAASNPVTPLPVAVHVRGNQIVNAAGRRIRLFGVNRSGTEYACVVERTGIGVFSGPSNAASIAAMASWHINAVRVSLNEDCWLGINGVTPAYGGRKYRRAIAAYVRALNSAGLVAILDLHWNAPGGLLSDRQQLMADADHAPAFWTAVAARFRRNPGVIFDLYNEPHGISWDCWLLGCQTREGWQTAGMQSLVDAVRRTGAKQPIMVGGLAHGGDVSGWTAHPVRDPLGQLIASVHVYEPSYCTTVSCWNRTLNPVAEDVPIVTGELGEYDRKSGFITTYMKWADDRWRHHRSISFLAWSWDVAQGEGGPSLIASYDGTPTTYGRGFQSHLERLFERGLIYPG
jgi:cellulose synthase/poly-beta-1,6-N-acetylglucosamine synthase-like glycosyltransferase